MNPFCGEVFTSFSSLYNKQKVEIYLIWNGITRLNFFPQEFLGEGQATRERLRLDQVLAAAILHLYSLVVRVGGATPDSDNEGSWSPLLSFSLSSHIHT